MIGRFIDSSVIISAFDVMDERNSESLITDDKPLFTSMLVYVEVIRNLARLDSSGREQSVEEEFENLFARMNVIEIDDWVWARAADVARASGVKSLDAVHLATAAVPGSLGIEFVTFDRRLALAARRLGMVVVGQE
ncbi:MAG: hypothetical protein RLZZ526_1866 [Actinomycetota bacterium]